MKGLFAVVSLVVVLVASNAEAGWFRRNYSQPTYSQPAAQPEATQPAPQPQPQPEQQAKVEPQPQPQVDLNEVEQQLVAQINNERARYGLWPLQICHNLMQSARNHCMWMTNSRNMVHSQQNLGENIAMGQPNVPNAVQTWMNSSGHRANILNPNYRQTGVAAYQTPEGTIFWCQQFFW